MPVERTETRSRSAFWLIVLKEVRLQQMTFVISALYVGLWASYSAWSHPEIADTLAYLHAAVIPVVIGGLASAEERQLLMADWQTLQPMAAWQQWAVKWGTAIGLTVLLAIGLPLLLSLAGSPIQLIPPAMAVPIVLCVMALYVSSLSTNGIRSLLTAAIVIIVAGSVGGRLIATLFNWLSPALWPIAVRITPFHYTSVTYLSSAFRWIPYLTGGPFYAGFLVLLLAFGSANHRAADRNVLRLPRQIAWIAGYVVAATVVTTFLNQLVAAGFRR